MNLEQKQKLFKKLRAEGNIPADVKITYEYIRERTFCEYAEALEKAKACGIKIHKAGDPFPEGVQPFVANTDVLANLGHMCLHDDYEDENTKKMLYYIIKDLVIPVVTTTILLEVISANDQGDPDTYNFMLKYCRFLDSSDNMEEVAKRTYQILTGENG